jgi:hypothetical protein
VRPGGIARPIEQHSKVVGEVNSGANRQRGAAPLAFQALLALGRVRQALVATQ